MFRKPTTKRQRFGAAVLAAGCIGAVGVAVTQLGGGANAADSVVPTPFVGPPALPPANPKVEEALRSVPELAEAPWLFTSRGQHLIGQVSDAQSLVFPPGTDYGEALTQIFVAAAEDGILPVNAKLAAPLPKGKVVSLPTDASRGVRVSLVAPFGYDIASGRILTPSTAVSNVTDANRIAVNEGISESLRQGRALAPGQVVDVPRLEKCQVMQGDVDPSSPDC